MHPPSSKHHVVTNFKKKTSRLKRIVANILFFISHTKLTLRNNLLTTKEYRAVKKMIRPGDIVLAGDHRHVSSMLIQGVVTHALLCTKRTRLIHAVGDGVQTTSLRHIFKEYDTLILVRPKLGDQKNVIDKAVTWAEKQLGKPYDYEFDTDLEKFFCTQLINESYHHAGFDLGIADHEPAKNIMTEHIRRFKNMVLPADIIKGNVEIIFLSSYLKRNDSGIMLTEPLWTKK